MLPVAAVDGAIEPRDIEPVRLLKHAAVGSQVATSGVDLEIPSSSPWINTHTPYLAHQLSTEYHRQSSEGYSTRVD